MPRAERVVVVGDSPAVVAGGTDSDEIGAEEAVAAAGRVDPACARPPDERVVLLFAVPLLAVLVLAELLLAVRPLTVPPLVVLLRVGVPLAALRLAELPLGVLPGVETPEASAAGLGEVRRVLTGSAGISLDFCALMDQRYAVSAARRESDPQAA